MTLLHLPPTYYWLVIEPNIFCWVDIGKKKLFTSKALS